MTSSSTKTVYLNDIAQQTTAITLKDFLCAQGIAIEKGGFAVAMNNTVIPHSTWETTPLPANAHIEIVSAIAGG